MMCWNCFSSNSAVSVRDERQDIKPSPMRERDTYIEQTEDPFRPSAGPIDRFLARRQSRRTSQPSRAKLFAEYCKSSDKPMSSLSNKKNE